MACGSFSEIARAFAEARHTTAKDADCCMGPLHLIRPLMPDQHARLSRITRLRQFRSDPGL